MSALTDVTKNALSLSVEDRVVLAQRVWESMGHFSDTEVEDAWMQEADRRWQEIESGTVQGIPAADVIRRARESLNG